MSQFPASMVFVSHAMQSHPCGGSDATEDKVIEQAKAARTARRGLLVVDIMLLLFGLLVGNGCAMASTERG